MVKHHKIKLKARSAGFHLITDEVLNQLPTLPASGLLNLFIQHTSCGLTINENCDPTVRADFEMSFNHLVPENLHYLHTAEGSDDMPAHIKSTIVGHSLTIPISEGKLELGTWQGVYLCEFRKACHTRSIIASIYS
jgi:secondary thiamine-phosphate synthase enzyme